MSQPSSDPVPPRLYEQDYMAMKRCKHGTFLYNLHDMCMGRSLDAYGQWAESELELLAQLVGPGDVVLDVGANIGTHTVFFSKLVTETGLVFAFEPQRLVYQNLCANVALNALTNVIALQQGAGRVDEIISLPSLDPRSDQNFGMMKLMGHRSGFPVPVVTIDGMQLNRCNLIKIDVEGMECDVLHGGRETIARFRPVLFLENNTLAGSAAILSVLDSLDYDSYWHVGLYFDEDNYFRNPSRLFAANMIDTNLLSFHRAVRVDGAGLIKVEGIDDNYERALMRMGLFQSPLREPD